MTKVRNKVKRTFRNKHASIQAQLAEQLLFVSGVKKDFQTIENTQEYLKIRELENEKEIKIPRIKTHLDKVMYQNNPTYIFGKLKDQKDKVILYLHGGSYNSNPIRYHFKFLDKVYHSTKNAIVMPIYPKAPKYTYKDAYVMIEEIYNDLIDKGYKNIVLMGDSAGGGLALGFTHYLIKEEKTIPKELILLSPWVDIEMNNKTISKFEGKDPMLSSVGLREMGKVWAGSMNTDSYLLSPINGDFSNFPKTNIFVGTHEIFYPDNKKIYFKMKEANVKVELFKYLEMNHCFPMFPIPEGRRAINDIVNIIKGNI